VITTLQRLLRAADVRFVRLLWCDNAGVVRAKAAHVDDTASLSGGIPVALAQMAVPVTADVVVDGAGLTPVGEAVLCPDWSTLAVLTHAPGHAHVACDLTVGGRPWDHCPRALVRQQVAALAGLGLEVRASFENEFVLLRRGPTGLVAVDDAPYATTGRLNAHASLLADLADAVAAHGMAVEHLHAESGPGQVELTVDPADPLTAADRQVAYRECVRGVAPRHGLVGSFLPVLTEGAAGSGCHLNLSLWRGGEDVTGSRTRETALSPEAEAFVAGVLHHLPGLCALTLASTNSYRRVRPHHWAGAFTAWGRGNREAAVRVTTAPDGAAARLELKASDATANPHLALGAVLAAGADGVRRGLAPPPEVVVDPGTLGDVARREAGVEPLPADLGAALERLRQDEVLLEALGSERARAYLAVKDAEWDALNGLSLAEEAALLAERY
jgi:glutamine synthetase